jgi:hypothetical protein
MTLPEPFYVFWCRHAVAQWTARPFMEAHTQQEPPAPPPEPPRPAIWQLEKQVNRLAKEVTKRTGRWYL